VGDDVTGGGILSAVMGFLPFSRALHAPAV